MAVKAKQPSEHADVLRQFLLHAQAEAVFQRAGAPRGGHLRLGAGLLGKMNGLRIGPHSGVVLVAENADGAVMAAGLHSYLALEIIAAVAQHAAVEAQAVGDRRHGPAAVP